MNTAEMRASNRDDLLAHVESLRNELGELDPTEAGFSDRIEAMSREAELVDTHLTLMDVAEHRDATAQLASTMGGVRSAGGDDTERRTIGELAVSEELCEWVNRSHSKDWSTSITSAGSLSDIFTRAVAEWGTGGPFGGSGYPNYDPTGSGYLLPVGQPIAPIPRQARLYLRDLIPTMTTTLAAIPYVQELNPTLYESASAVAEGQPKPNAQLSFIGQKADPTVLAATLVISKQLFEDAAAVVQYINTRLPYLVKFKEDQELLNGDGTWPNILGINNQTGVQTQGAVNTDNAQTFGAAFAAVELHDGTPTAVVLNPTNAWTMFTKRAAGGSGTFDAGTPFSALPLTVWGVPSYRTRAMPVNTALVGDFQLGAMIADREEVNIQTYRERYAEQNQILMVCEERIGLMVFRPDLFVNTTTV